MTAKPPHHVTTDEHWLASVRADLDSKADDWAVKVKGQDGISKLQCLGLYLDAILKDLGHPGKIHDCPTCGDRHLDAKP